MLVRALMLGGSFLILASTLLLAQSVPLTPQTCEQQLQTLTGRLAEQYKLLVEGKYLQDTNQQAPLDQLGNVINEFRVTTTQARYQKEEFDRYQRNTAQLEEVARLLQRQLATTRATLEEREAKIAELTGKGPVAKDMGSTGDK